MQSEMFCDPMVPVPREGWKGQLERFIGPEASPAELVLQLAERIALPSQS